MTIEVKEIILAVLALWSAPSTVAWIRGMRRLAAEKAKREPWDGQERRAESRLLQQLHVEVGNIARTIGVIESDRKHDAESLREIKEAVRDLPAILLMLEDLEERTTKDRARLGKMRSEVDLILGRVAVLEGKAR